MAMDNFNTQLNQPINNTQKPQPKLKPLFIVIIVLAIVAVIGITVAIVSIVEHNNQQKAIEATQKAAETSSIEPGKLSFSKKDEYSEMLNIFFNLDNMMLTDDLINIFSVGEINQDYIHIDKVSGKCYIAANEIDLNKDYTGSEIEFITFDYLADGEEPENDRLSGFVYHSYHNNHHSLIEESSEEGFIHSLDGVTSSFEEKSDAIEDYLNKYN